MNSRTKKKIKFIDVGKTGKFPSTANIYRGQPFGQQCPPWIKIFPSRDPKPGLIFMFDVILDSGEKKSISRIISVHL